MGTEQPSGRVAMAGQSASSLHSPESSGELPPASSCGPAPLLAPAVTLGAPAELLLDGSPPAACPATCWSPVRTFVPQLTAVTMRTKARVAAANNLATIGPLAGYSWPYPSLIEAQPRFPRYSRGEKAANEQGNRIFVYRNYVCRVDSGSTGQTYSALALRAREWLSRSMIAAEAPGWRGATKAHTAGM